MDNASGMRPISVRIPEACRLTGIGRSKLYQLIAAREIQIVKIGAITLIPMSSLERLIEGRSNDS
jgi:excisionase family DNA binding protein